MAFMRDWRGKWRQGRDHDASDYAVTAACGDLIVRTVADMDIEGRIWVLHLWREQTPSNEWVEAVYDLVTSTPRGRLEPS